MRRYVREAREGAAARVSASAFTTGAGAEELHVVVVPARRGAIQDQVAALEAAYLAALAELGHDPATAVFRRVFASDLANQHGVLARSPLFGRNGATPGAALSFVEQPPLPGARVALFAYHVKDDARPVALERDGATVSFARGGLRHLWTTGLDAGEEGARVDSARQTRITFDAYERILAGYGARMADHTVRTWVFVQGIDRNYEGMVCARRELFAAQGLTDDTHYIASTGIEGRGPDLRQVVQLDAYAIAGLSPDRVRYLHAQDNLSRTSRYGVTFERGVRVDHGDRQHVIISGTASIDHEGDVLHVGDVRRQTHRTADNIEALLDEAGAGVADLAHLIVYLRDDADEADVRAVAEERFPAVPYLVVRAPVCRPQWLVEIEAMAIRETSDDRYPPF